MKQAHLIAFNTLVTYAQSLVGLVVGLLSARWTLQALGAEDLGLFGVVGSVLLLLTFLNTALSVGVSRFYAFSIGKGRTRCPAEAKDDLTRWFNTALSAHVVIGTIIFALGWSIGGHAVRNWLNIPPDRLDACVVAFHYTMANTLVSVLSVPFTAMFSAHQQITALTLLRILQNLLLLGLSWMLHTVTSDRIIFYAAGTSLISIGISLFLIALAATSYTACRPKAQLIFSKNRLGELLSYVGWKIFGTACVVARNGGIPVMINLYFGPVLNAAFNIANRVSIQSTTLSASLQSAFQPAIVAAEGMSDRSRTIAMSLRFCRLGTLLVLVFVVPLAMEMSTVLQLWLKTPPPYTGELCLWLLGMLVIDRMTAGHMIAVNARGKIAAYEFIQGSTFLLALPIIWLLNKSGVGPSAIGISLFTSNLAYCIGRLLFAKILLGISITKWIQKVALPVSMTLAVSSGLGLLITQYLNAGIFRLACTILVTSTIVTLLGFHLLTVQDERRELLSMTRKSLAKLAVLLKPIIRRAA